MKKKNDFSNSETFQKIINFDLRLESKKSFEFDN